MVNIKVVIKLLYLVIIISIFLGSYYLIYESKKEKSLNRKKAKYNGLDKILKKNDTGYFSYDRIEKYLRKKGNPLKLSPSGYIISKLLVSIIFFIIFSEDPIIAIVMTVPGFFVINGIIYFSDKNDMKKIKIQIVDVYDFLSIQTAAGVFIGSALTECYLMVRNRRLKIALAELCAEINLTKDINGALDKFSSSFDSIEIEAFVLTIKQSLRTGKIKNALDDLSNSQKDRNIILLQEETDKIKTTKDIIQLMMYFGILITIMYGLFLELSRGWENLF